MSSLTVGNVSPPKRSPPVGNLIFDADFESGNLGRVDQITTCEYDLFIRPDTCNSKYRVWFYFSVDNALGGQRIVFNIVNFSKTRTLFESGFASPVVKPASQANWSKIPAKHLYYYRSTVHGDRNVLSFAFVFETKEKVEFAYAVPYSYSKLQRFLSDLESRKWPYFRRDPLTFTVQKRRVDLVTIADENPLEEKRNIVFITSRVHPGETPSSYVLQGLMEYLVSDDPRAAKLRAQYVFKIVPMLNPDGVYLGNYRCSLMGFDLNRHWQNPSNWAQPTIQATKNLLLQYNNNPQVEVVLYLDLHAHSQKTNSFLYGNSGSFDRRLRERQLWLPHLLSDLTDDYSLTYTQFNTDSEKLGTSRRTMGGILSCLCYTLETSFFAYHPNDNMDGKPIPYLPYKYESLGEALGVAILQYFEVESGKREIALRPFDSFVHKKTKSFKEAGKALKTVKTSLKQ